MLRNRFLQQVELNLVSRSNFKPEDFKIQHRKDPADQDRAILRIEYAFNNAYFLEGRIKGGSYSVSYCPGVVILNESEIFTKQQEFYDCVNHWANRIREELSAIPFHRELAEQRSIIEEIEEQVASFPDEYFTKEESEKVQQRLNELESQLRENIEKHAKDQEEAKRQISELRTDFEILRQTLDGLNKKGWAGTLLVRVSRWVKNPQNRELLKSGAEVAKVLLTDGTHHPPSS